jgi:hypothetical protein
METMYKFEVGDEVLYNGKSKLGVTTNRIGKTGTIVARYEGRNSYSYRVIPMYRVNIKFNGWVRVVPCRECNLELVSPKEPDWRV